MSPTHRHVALPPLVLPNMPTGEKVARHTFGQERDAIEVPNLIETQMRSFDWFRTEGLKELFREISPITDFTGKNLELRFGDFHFGTPRHNEHECREYDLTFSAPLRVNVQLRILSTGEIKESDTFLGDFPQMTENGTFVINGAERVVVSQLIRSPGVYFSAEDDANTGRKMHSAKLIPNRGAWLEFETNKRDIISVKVDRKRKMPVTVLLRAILAWQAGPNGEGHWCDDSDLVNHGHSEHVEEVFGTLEEKYDHKYLRTTLDKDSTRNSKEALIELYKRLRPGDPPTLDNAKSLLESYFFSERRYDLAKVGRYKLNKNLYERDGVTDPPSLDIRVLLDRDIFKIIERIILLNNNHPCLQGRRYRPFGQSARAYGGRIDPTTIPRRLVAHGARHQRAHVVGRIRKCHPQCVNQHPTGAGGYPRVVWWFAVVTIHGPDQSVGRAHQQASFVGSWTWWVEPRSRRLRSPRRPPFALRPDLSRRNARRS